MKLKKTREAIAELEMRRRDAMSGGSTIGAIEELADAESLLREAAALKAFAVAGLSAFHGNLCSGGHWAVPAQHCQDPKCRAWAAAVRGADGLETVRNAALEEAAQACENMEANRKGWTGWPKCCAEEIRALKRGG